MNKEFYSELLAVTEEALEDLDRYEQTGLGENVFDKLKSVGTPFLDNRELSITIRDDIPIRERVAFHRATHSLAECTSLAGRAGANEPIKSHLALVKKILSNIVNQKASSPLSSTIFYSWQSNLPNKTNRSFIQKCLESAANEINREMVIESRLKIDADTSGAPGSPDIIHTILNKIDSSAIFIADVSLVGKEPNPNVMFELGYAMKALGDSKILMVFNENYGQCAALPFDLGFKRQIIYQCGDDSDPSIARKALTSKLKKAIARIISN